jgi:antitoxin component YwqK of YwqJK toxin-antitoxin module
MKGIIFPALIVLLMLSCNNEEKEAVTPASNDLVAHEMYYNADGTLKATVSYEYNDKRHVTSIHFDYTDFDSGDSETTFTYDNSGNQIKAVTVTNGIIPPFIFETAYENNLKKSETSYWSNTGAGTRLVYYYNEDLIEHTELLWYPDLQPSGDGPDIYKYDDKRRLIQKGITKFEYDDADRISSFCNYQCYTNEYNADGRLAKVYELDASGNKTLSEEYIYENGRLAQKNMYHGPSPDVFVIKYDY